MPAVFDDCNDCLAGNILCVRHDKVRSAIHATIQGQHVARKASCIYNITKSACTLQCEHRQAAAGVFAAGEHCI